MLLGLPILNLVVINVLLYHGPPLGSKLSACFFINIKLISFSLDGLHLMNNIRLVVLTINESLSSHLQQHANCTLNQMFQ